jgi:predicted dehydrogenase
VTDGLPWRDRLFGFARARQSVAIAGCGSIGSRYARILHASGFRVGLFDSDAARAAALCETFGPDASVVTASSWQSLLEERPGFALVATPPAHHADPTLAALDLGIPVLVEKPLAADLTDAARIARAVEAGRAACRCVCNMRFHPGIETLRTHLPRIGEIALARAHFGHRLSQMRPSGLRTFAGDAGLGGGVILDCIHEFDYLQSLLGPLEFASARLGHVGPEEIGAEDWAHVILRTGSGKPVTLDLDFISRRKHRGCEIVGTEGSLVWQSLGRAPEIVRVVFADRTSEEVLFMREGLEADDEYGLLLVETLASFDGAEAAAEPFMPETRVQTVPEALLSLELCLAARSAGGAA